MTARLISYSQPVNIIGIDNIQDLVAYCARVSNPSNQLNNITLKMWIIILKQLNNDLMGTLTEYILIKFAPKGGVK